MGSAQTPAWAPLLLVVLIVGLLVAPACLAAWTEPSGVPTRAEVRAEAIAEARGLGLATSGAPLGAPSTSGAYVVDDDSVFAFLGYADLADTWTSVGPDGSQVFAFTLWLMAYDLRDIGQTLPVEVCQRGLGCSNQTFSVGAGGTLAGLTLQASLVWRATTITIGSGPTAGVWKGFTSTPATLIPVSFLSVGGLDLLAIVIVAEAVYLFGIGTFLAWRTVRRALYAPRFPLKVWGHVFLFATLAFIIGDYQFVSQTFAGWSPVLYVFPIGLLWYLSMLSYFNRATELEVLQVASAANQDLQFRRYPIRVGRRGGDVVLLKDSWSDMWARFWGHFVTLYSPAPTTAPAWLPRVTEYRSPTDKYGRKSRAKRGQAPETWEFSVINSNEQDDKVSGIAFAKAGGVLSVVWPKLSWTREVTLPATHYENGAVKEEAETRKKLTWPHYIDGSAEQFPLESIHYKLAVAASAGLLTGGDLAHIVSETETAYYVLYSEFDSRVNATARSYLRAFLSMEGRTREDIEEAEAWALSHPAAPRAPKASPTTDEDLGHHPATSTKNGGLSKHE